MVTKLGHKIRAPIDITKDSNSILNRKKNFSGDMYLVLNMNTEVEISTTVNKKMAAVKSIKINISFYWLYGNSQVFVNCVRAA